jgi:hypothetical protein
MSETGSPPALTVVSPGEGRAGHVGPQGVVFKLWGEGTGGAVAIVEHPFPVGALVPPHLHTREDRGELHTMWNGSSTPARMIDVISPAGFERYFRDLTTEGAPPFEAVATLAETTDCRSTNPMATRPHRALQPHPAETNAEACPHGVHSEVLEWPGVRSDLHRRESVCRPETTLRLTMGIPIRLLPWESRTLSRWQPETDHIEFGSSDSETNEAAMSSLMGAIPGRGRIPTWAAHRSSDRYRHRLCRSGWPGVLR